MGYISFENVKKEYQIGQIPIRAVEECSFNIDKGEFVVILGPSGAGKTTILNLLGGMDRASEGAILVDDADITKYDNNQLVEYRRKNIGFVFQFYNLIENLNTKENVEIAGQLTKNPLSAERILEQVGLADRMENFPSQLSGGEQQRVSIARAIAKNPKLLLCDEPTGALDSKTGRHIIDLLQENCKTSGTTTVIITHNNAIAETADKVIRVHNGTISNVQHNDTPKKVSEIQW